MDAILGHGSDGVWMKSMGAVHTPAPQPPLQVCYAGCEQCDSDSTSAQSMHSAWWLCISNIRQGAER